MSTSSKSLRFRRCPISGGKWLTICASARSPTMRMPRRQKGRLALGEIEDRARRRRRLAAIADDLEPRVARVGVDVGEVAEGRGELRHRRAGGDHRGLGGALPDEAVGLELAERLPYGDQADAEAPGDIGLLGQGRAERIGSVDDRRAQDRGKLAIERAVVAEELARRQEIESAVGRGHGRPGRMHDEPI